MATSKDNNLSMTRPTWDDLQWTALPHQAGALRADVCVVGLGGSGLTAVQTFLDQGASVIGIDADLVANGAAGSNGGFLLAGTARFYHDTLEVLGRERARKLYAITVTEIDRMVSTMPDIARRTGSLRIAMSDDELADCEVQLAAMQADHLQVQRYDGKEGRGLLIPTDGVFNPLARCRLLAQQVLQRGARLFENSPAVSFAKGLVRTPQGHIHCKHIVVAVDGKLEMLFPQLANRVRTARLQMLGTAPTREIDVPYAVYARWGYEYWQQLADGRLVLGGFRDRGGDAEWTFDTQPCDRVQSEMEHFLRSHLGVNAAITHRWAASASFTPNGLPVIEQIENGLWVMGAYNGTGNIVGALCGHAVAQHIGGQRTELFSLLIG
jgi:gamma-glutamylputrescine oxidase